MQGLALWIYGLLLEIVEFIADSLLQVFNMDLAYFEANVPVTKEIVNIIIVAGWAILIGNLVFQAMKSMMSGIGFEGEDPKILFCRTFVFGFLLLASRQICEIGLGMTSQLNIMLKTPDAVKLELPPLDIFVIPGSWLLVMIIGLILMFQIVKFFFEIAERYVVLVMLTVLALLAFGVGGSKNTEDIFKGWARMFGSSCLMMLLNTVFLKLLLSAMSNVPNAAGMLPWMFLVVAIARVARKMDEIVARIGLNTARTGDPISHGGIMYPIMVMRTLGGIVSKTASAGKATSGAASSGRKPGGGRGGASPPPPSPSPNPASSGSAPNQPQQGGGGASAPSGAGNGAAAPAPTPAPAGAQPAMSTTSSGIGKEPPPSRPPVGFGRNRSRPDIYRDDERDAADTKQAGTGKPPLSVDSATPGSIRAERPETAQQRDSGTGGKENNGRRTTPPLSVDSRTPDIPGTAGHKPVMDSTGTTPAAADGTKPPQRYRPKKPVNIDIYRDDDSADGLRSTNGPRPAGGPRPASIYKGRPPVTSGQSSHTNGGSQTVSHKDTRSTMIQRNTEETTRSTANATSSAAAPGTASVQTPPAKASSPGAGRIGGLNQPGGSNRSGGTTVPGGTHRPTSAPALKNTRPSGAATGSTTPQPTPSETQGAGRGTYAARRAPSATDGNHPVTNTGNASRQRGKTEGEASAPATAQSGRQANAQGTRPTRYKRVDRNPQKQPEGTAGQDMAQTGTKPASGRPMPGKPGTGAQPPTRGPSPGGGNRP